MSRPPFTQATESASDRAVRGGEVFAERSSDLTVADGSNHGSSIFSQADKNALLGVYVNIQENVNPADIGIEITIDETANSSSGRIMIGGTLSDNWDFSQPIDVQSDETVHVQIRNDSGISISYSVTALYRGNN